MASLGSFFANRRIAVSRIFAGTFLTAMLVTSSAWEGSMFGHALFVAGVVLVGVATVGRLWCALYIGGRKNAVLVTEGPYAMTRNPLYFFSFLGFVGLGLATEALTVPLAFGVGQALVS